ncbi:phage portal protein [Rhizobium sp. 9140]|uniref:phage portal protein n=1 Tax=Rhizobium sp. 9140 TaxID=1761900 RepID=UPI00079A1CA5|nr:phage portal protein [Rhizobium sp. 9140]CZT34625.1 phage portal protein, HK97 family [Rhizobium sp. 9140]
MSFFKRKSSQTVETRDAPVSDPDDVLAALWSGASSGSVAISGASALRVPAVAAAVRVISEAAATLQVRIMERAADGSETEDVSHPVGALLRGDVNGWSSGFDLIRDMVAGALIHDWGSLAYVNRIGAEIREIIRYQPAAISVQNDPFTAEPTFRLNGLIVPSSSILHVRGPFDKAPITLAAEAIGVCQVMEEHVSSFFKNGAVPSTVILNKLKVGEAGAKNMLRGWRAAFGGPRASGKTAVLWDDATIQQLSMTSVDSQFLELRKFQVLEVARAFRVPPSMLFDLDRATWSNSEQMGREFLIYCLEPWLRAVETAFTRSLFSAEERGRYRILLDRDDLTRADLNNRATAVSSLVSAKLLNRNEGRSWFDLAPVPGGNEFENPHINPDAPGVGHNGGPPIEDDSKEPDDGSK